MSLGTSTLQDILPLLASTLQDVLLSPGYIQQQVTRRRRGRDDPRTFQGLSTYPAPSTYMHMWIIREGCRCSLIGIDILQDSILLLAGALERSQLQLKLVYVGGRGW